MNQSEISEMAEGGLANFHEWYVWFIGAATAEEITAFAGLFSDARVAAVCQRTAPAERPRVLIAPMRPTTPLLLADVHALLDSPYAGVVAPALACMYVRYNAKRNTSARGLRFRQNARAPCY